MDSAPFSRRLDWIRIHQLELSCIVGIRPREREREQPVVIDVELGVDTRRAGRSGRISHTVDYSKVEVFLSAMLTFRRYQLIESAAEELCAMLIGTEPQLEEVKLRIEKPAALAGKARAASVEVQRNRADFPTATVDVVQSQCVFSGEQLWRSEEAELCLVRLPPRARWLQQEESDRRSLQWLVSGRLNAVGASLEPGVIATAGYDGQFDWANQEATDAVMFRCVAAL